SEAGERQPRAKRIRAGLLVHFRRHAGGSTAVEFGLIAIPFVALMFAIAETGLLYFADQTLETAVANTARLVRTGQVQAQGLSATDFKQKICDQVAPLLSCADKLRVDVSTSTTFGTISLAPPLDANGNL